MKTIFLILVFLFSIGTNLTFAKHPGDQTPKATAVFWVDKKDKKENEPLKVRTVKVRVNIERNGKVTIKSYVNEQPGNVKNYLNQKLQTFRVTERMLSSGYIKTGDQYVQLRYIPALVK